jgi:hypothetical protein
MPLPVAGKVYRLAPLHRQRRNPIDLIAIAHTTIAPLELEQVVLEEICPLVGCAKIIPRCWYPHGVSGGNVGKSNKYLPLDVVVSLPGQ